MVVRLFTCCAVVWKIDTRASSPSLRRSFALRMMKGRRRLSFGGKGGITLINEERLLQHSASLVLPPPNSCAQPPKGRRGRAANQRASAPFGSASAFAYTFDHSTIATPLPIMSLLSASPNRRAPGIRKFRWECCRALTGSGRERRPCVSDCCCGEGRVRVAFAGLAVAYHDAPQRPGSGNHEVSVSSAAGAAASALRRCITHGCVPAPFLAPSHHLLPQSAWSCGVWSKQPHHD